MNNYRLKIACGWAANSTKDVGTQECETLKHAQKEAHQAGLERISSSAEVVERVMNTKGAKYRLKASFDWVLGEKDLGVFEFDTLEDAEEAAWQEALTHLESWAEPVNTPNHTKGTK